MNQNSNKTYNSYSAIAHRYNSLTTADADYNLWANYVCTVLADKKSGVDLACGTGKMTAQLIKNGYDVTGIDNSREMLDQAVKNVRAKFVKQDMRAFTLPSPVQFAVCVNDGVNYLKPREILPFFCRVYNSLQNGGVFVFDVSSAYKLQNVIANNVFFDDNADATLLWTNKLGKNSVKMDITLFEKHGETFTRSDETHVQYIHTKTDIQTALKSAGFNVKQITNNYGEGKATAKSMRLTFVAEK